MIVRIALPVLFALTLVGCDVNVQSCSGKQICISQGKAEQIIGSGVSRSETRAVNSFSSIRFAGAGRLVVDVGATDSVTVSSDDNVLPKIKTETKDGVLFLGLAENSSVATNELVYRVSAKGLRGVDATGAGSVQISKIASDAFDVTLSGSSNIQLSGKVKSLSLTISGSGMADASKLAADMAKVVISGSGRSSLNVHQTLDAVISGSGNVTYSGAPQIRKTISGSGSLGPALAD